LALYCLPYSPIKLPLRKLCPMTIENMVPADAGGEIGTLLFESSPDCIKLLDCQGQLTAMNLNGQCAMEIDDFTAVAGTMWKALWPEQNHPQIEQALNAAYRGEVGHFHGFCPTAKGAPRWWDVIVTPVRSLEGDITSLFAVSRDVTSAHLASMEREKLVRQLQAANDHISGIFEQAPAFMCVLRGPEHVFEMVNQRYQQLVGRRDLIGQSIRQGLPEVEGQGYLELLDRVYRSGESFQGAEMPVLLQRTPDAPLETRFVDFVYMPLRDAEEAITGILVHGVDQTERKNAEADLYASRERFQKIVDQAGTGVVETDVDGRIVLANRKYCEMLGYAEEELLGLSVLDITAPDSIHATREEVAALVEGGPGFVLDKQYRQKDGTFKWAQSSVNALRDSTGTYQGIVAIIVDITESRQAADALRASEERYRTLFETMDQGFCVIEMISDTDGTPVDYRFLEMNQMFEQHTGLSNVVNKTALALVPGMDDFWVEKYGQVAATGEPTRFEHRDPAMKRWFDVNATRIGGNGSNKVAILFQDISARKATAEALRSQAARQVFQLELADKIRPLADPNEITAAASEHLGHHLKISRVTYAEVDDAQGTFFIRRDWNNKGVVSIAGEVRRLNDFGPEIVADLRDGKLMAVDDVLSDPRTANFKDAYTVIGIRANAAVPLLKDGRLSAVLALHADSPFHWTEEALALAQDTVERTWLAVDNIVAQHALRNERDLSKSIFDGMTEGFLLLDRHWIVLEVNEVGARLVQHARSKMIGAKHWDTMPELVGSELEALYKRVRASGQAETIEYHHTFPDKTTCWLEIRVYSLAEEKLAIFYRDITDRKATEWELLESGRRKDEFLAMLAHELRNPLAPIGAAAELLQMGNFDEARVRKTSEIIARQVRHMTHLIDDLLDVSRVTRGLVELNTSVIDVRHAVTEAVEQVNPLIHSRSHQLALYLAPDATFVQGDKKRLVQVVANLLNNAAKYTPEGGDLELRTMIRNDHVVIEIVDTGIGMTPDLVTHAFDLFAQAERTSDRASGGLGLGLALVKSLVNLHGGSVTCESKGLGKGSKFTIAIPLARASERDLLQHSNARKSDDQIKSLRILVVDDNADAASMLAMLLETVGHEVAVEHSSYRALERAKQDLPQVCLLDIGLPDLDGYQLAQRIRELDETNAPTLIAVTGYGQENDRMRAVASGFAHHLVKPVDTAKLTSILAEISESLR
jgi:PAS domain S-box-containing protein